MYSYDAAKILGNHINAILSSVMKLQQLLIRTKSNERGLIYASIAIAKIDALIMLLNSNVLLNHVNYISHTKFHSRNALLNDLGNRKQLFREAILLYVDSKTINSALM